MPWIFWDFFLTWSIFNYGNLSKMKVVLPSDCQGSLDTPCLGGSDLQNGYGKLSNVAHVANEMHKWGNKNLKSALFSQIFAAGYCTLQDEEREGWETASSFTSRLTWTNATLKLPFTGCSTGLSYWTNSYSSLHLHFLIDIIDTLKCALCTAHSFYMLQPVQCLFRLTKATEEWPFSCPLRALYNFISYIEFFVMVKT